MKRVIHAVSAWREADFLALALKLVVPQGRKGSLCLRRAALWRQAILSRLTAAGFMSPTKPSAAG